MSNGVPEATEFSKWLSEHDKEFLLVRLQGVGFDMAMEMMRQQFEKETNNGHKGN